ncbi:carboxypeptidase-like regulatory domain-containing protein [Mucilaginibacter celer]|uniref:carboxypeptidase-like regulatory domain-containing protein n=1 Tax=Mucilaginibacter celer TaxID=2305508 RepID=UPI00196931F2|nr:carboxypeptidase-like regulatory domain-containing protein [Mucilaginibacter celer]
MDEPVRIKGAKTGTTTDADGGFQISAPRNASLQVSSVGYVTQDVYQQPKQHHYYPGARA